MTPRGRARWAAPLVLGVFSCTPRTIPFAGVEVALDADPSLPSTSITALTVTIGSVDGGTQYKSATTFPIDNSGATGSAQFPTSFAIESNGDPNATVAFNVAVSGGNHLLDDERYVLVHVPSARAVELRVLFTASCPARATAPGVVACPLDDACSWQGDSWLCDASRLPGPAVDAGWPSLGAASATDAGDESSTDGAGMLGCMGGLNFDEDAAIDIPCEAGCDLGAQCVEGQCVPVPPSCREGTPGAGHDCGLAGKDDCCASDEVAAGTFYRNYDGLMYTDKSWPASVSQFRLDRYEVTIGRFREFVRATTASPVAWTPDAASGKHTHLHCGNGLSSGGDAGVTYETGWQLSWNQFLPGGSQSSWDGALRREDCYPDASTDYLPTDSRDWTPDAGEAEHRPINCVTWYEAYAFCIWDGGFLPSNAEWDYAAAGGSEQRAFSWGSDGPYENATYADYSCYYPPSTSGHYDCEGLENIADVGFASLGKGRWGQLDLTGGVYEPVLDTPSLFPLPCVDCAVTNGGSERLDRGGSWYSNSPQITNSEPMTVNPNQVAFVSGVRCARTPSP